MTTFQASLGEDPYVCSNCGQKWSTHVSSNDVVNQCPEVDSRRQVAIDILEEWQKAESAAVWYEEYASKRPVSGLSKNSFTIHQAAAALRNYADALREDILMLMGVNDTPAATLELADVAQQYQARYRSDDPRVP